MSNLIKNYFNVDFNNLLEDLKPYTKDSFNKIKPSSTIGLPNTPILYLEDIKIIICRKCKIYINPTYNTIKNHLKVSLSIL